jgi:hypothetical protein
MPDLTVRVGPFRHANWDSNPLLLPLPEALRFLRRPLRLLLENSRKDGGFLKAITPTVWRKRFQDLLTQRAVELSHAGGLTEMKAQIAQSSPEDLLRLWALFDSDAREPGRPSKQSEDLRQTCRDRQASHHQLKRRFIESYLPVQALTAWAHSSHGNLRQPRRKKAEAFAQMDNPQRQHYNLKAGFQGDRSHGIPAFYGHHADNPHLQEGFGDSISDLFKGTPFPIQEEWLIRDGQSDEAAEIFQAIFRRL